MLSVNIMSFRNRVAAMSFADASRTAFFLFLNFVFFTGLFWGAWKLLSVLNFVPMAGNLLVNKLSGFVFLASFSMVAFSALIISFNTIYFSKDLQWLLSAPVPVTKVFAFKALLTSFYSAWMVVVAIIPFILALGYVKGVELVFYPLVFALLVPFFGTASFIGTFFALTLVRVFPARKTRDILLFVGVFFVTGVYVTMRLIEPERFVKPDGLEIAAQYLNYLDAPIAVHMPSWWITAAVFSLIGRNFNDFVFYAVLILGSSGLMFAILVFTARSLYFKGLSGSQASDSAQNTRRHSFKTKKVFAAIVQKDASVFIRDANQWSQLMFLGALTAVYLFSIYKLPLDTVYLQNLVAFFNVGLIGFISAAVALRFVFPSVSLEGDSFWFLLSAPVSRSKIYLSKLFFSGIPVVVLGTLLVILSNILLKTDTPIFIVSMVASVLIMAGMSSLAMGAGSVFPKFGHSSVSEIESSQGGLFYMMAALFYLGLNLSLWAVPMKAYYMVKLNNGVINWQNLLWPAIWILLLNLAAVLTPAYFGLKSLHSLER